MFALEELTLIAVMRMLLVTSGYAMLCAVDGCTIGAASFLRKMSLGKRLHAATYFGVGHAFFAGLSLSIITALLLGAMQLLSAIGIVAETTIETSNVGSVMSHLAPWALALLAYMLAAEMFDNEGEEDVSILGKPLFTRLWIATLASLDSATWGPTGSIANLGFAESIVAFAGGGAIVMAQVVIFSYGLSIVERIFGGDFVKLGAIAVLLSCIGVHGFRLWIETNSLLTPLLGVAGPWALVAILVARAIRKANNKKKQNEVVVTA